MVHEDDGQHGAPDGAAKNFSAARSEAHRNCLSFLLRILLAYNPVLKVDHLTQQFVAFTNKSLKQLQQIADTISSHLQKQTEAINKANEIKDKSENSAPVLRSEIQIPQAIIDRKNSDDAKTYRLQKWTLWVSIVTVILIAFYTTLMYFQESDLEESISQNQILLKQARIQSTASLRVAKDTRESMELSRQQLVGTQAATLDFRFDVYFQPPNPSGLRSLIYPISGTVMATNVHMEGKASWVTFPQLRTISTEPFKFDIPELRRGDSQNAGVNIIPLKGVTVENWLPLQMQTIDKTIQIKGTFNYNNGFYPVPAQPFCFVWYSHPVIMGNSAQGFVNCSELKAQMSYFIFLEKKAAQPKK